MINSADEFYQLRTSENPEKYLRAAWDEAPIEIWYEVLRKYPDMAFWIAQNESVQIEVLFHLSSHPEWRVRSMIASKNKITEDLQMKLAMDEDVFVRNSVARNKKATEKVLKLLVDDEDEEIKKIVKDRLSKKHFRYV